MDKESVCAFALGKICMLEPVVARKITDSLGSAAAVFSLSREEMTEFLGPFNKYSGRIASEDLGRDELELERIMAGGHKFICHNSPAYPEALSVCDDAPIGFFITCEGDAGEILKRESISIVGTRDISPYGREWCERIVGSLASSGQRPTIVSGMAFGVDICSHLAALENGLPTIAVLGTGIGQVYPRQHQAYAERLLRSPGCALISEYPPNGCCISTTFLCRNRIIAGLSRATILVESKIKGGGMTTACMASSYGRDVFAVPGRNNDLCSQGCNRLIRAHVAEALTSCAELLEALSYNSKPTVRNRPRDIKSFYEGKLDGRRIKLATELFQLIRGNSGIQVGEISERLGIELKDALAIAGMLESDGFIQTDILLRCSIRRRNPVPL